MDSATLPGVKEPSTNTIREMINIRGIASSSRRRTTPNMIPSYRRQFVGKSTWSSAARPTSACDP
jgi:hypothetical protein